MIETICSRCSIDLDHPCYDIQEHPLIPRIATCFPCAGFIHDAIQLQIKDNLPLNDICQWCSEGGSLLLCSTCEYACCEDCIKSHFGLGALDEIMKDDDWMCFRCNEKPIELLQTSFDSLKSKSVYSTALTAIEEENISDTELEFLRNQLKDGDEEPSDEDLLAVRVQKYIFEKLHEARLDAEWYLLYALIGQYLF